ncbi:hydrolase [Candidatus Sumerlaeota bacterium]|nr:hydrolase [Candidatus Sumerlaeota bacterium]
MGGDAHGWIDAEDSVLLIVDLQEKFAPHISRMKRIVQRTEILLRAARLLEIPILATEQYPKGLGPTVAPIAELLGDTAPIEKTAFGCFGEPNFTAAFDALGRKTLVLAGIETHVCVLQTALEGLERGLRVIAVQDAISSRKPADRKAGMRRMTLAGCTPVSTEMILFEWMRDAKHPQFKAVQGLIQ